MKSRDGKSQRREEKKEKVSEESSGGSKSRLAKAAGAERWKIARRCGAKHMSKSKCIKHLSFGALLEVAMSKKCTPLWREAHFEVKSVKNWRVRSTFRRWDVEKVHAVVARSTFRSQNVKNIRGSDHFWRFRCRFAWQAQGIVHLVKRSKTWGFCGIL